jgi:hypothetical protein
MKHSSLLSPFVSYEENEVLWVGLGIVKLTCKVVGQQEHFGKRWCNNIHSNDTWQDDAQENDTRRKNKHIAVVETSLKCC